MEAEHFKAHRSKKEMQKMSLFEKFITEGTEKADELAKEGARLDGGDMAQVRAITILQEREEVYAALQCAGGFHCLVEEWKDCEELIPNPEEKCFCFTKKEKHRTECCVAANTDRCMTWGRSSNFQMPEKCEGPRWLGENSKHKLGRWEQIAFGRARLGEKVQEVHRDARKMRRTKVVDERFEAHVQKMGKIAFGRARHGEKS